MLLLLRARVIKPGPPLPSRPFLAASGPRAPAAGPRCPRRRARSRTWCDTFLAGASGAPALLETEARARQRKRRRSRRHWLARGPRRRPRRLGPRRQGGSETPEGQREREREHGDVNRVSIETHKRTTRNRSKKDWEGERKKNFFFFFFQNQAVRSGRRGKIVEPYRKTLHGKQNPRARTLQLERAAPSRIPSKPLSTTTETQEKPDFFFSDSPFFFVFSSLQKITCANLRGVSMTMYFFSLHHTL